MPNELTELARLLADEHLSVPSEELPTLPSQEELTIEPVNLCWIQTDPRNLGKEAARAVTDLVRKSDGGSGAPIAWADVVLVTDELATGRLMIDELPSGIKVITTYAMDENHRRPQKLAFFKGDARVKATTVHSIKGWEATSVVAAISSNGGSQGARLLYTAITRLNRRRDGSHLTVVCADERFREYGRYWPDFEEREDGSQASRP